MTPKHLIPLTLGAALAASTANADVVQFYAERAKINTQSDAATVEATSFTAEMGAYANDYSQAFIAGGTLTKPDSSQTPLVADIVGNDVWWGVWATADTETELNAAAPSGEYMIDYVLASEEQVSVTHDFASAEFPADPMASNYGDLQSVNPAQPFDVTWTAWADVGDNGMATVRIWDTAGNIIYNDFHYTSSLGMGDMTTYTVAANVLQPDTTYTGEIILADVFEHSWMDVPGQDMQAEMSTYNYTATRFSIQTGSTAVDTPNPFGWMPHTGSSWVPPMADSTLGWMNDMFFPWVYSEAVDMAANDGSYTGMDGWLYVMFADPSAPVYADGFYAYRVDTGTWIWTELNSGGWVYDYGDGADQAAGWVNLMTGENG